jgi:predicted membrane protein
MTDTTLTLLFVLILIFGLVMYHSQIYFFLISIVNTYFTWENFVFSVFTIFLIGIIVVVDKLHQIFTEDYLIKKKPKKWKVNKKISDKKEKDKQKNN